MGPGGIVLSCLVLPLYKCKIVVTFRLVAALPVIYFFRLRSRSRSRRNNSRLISEIFSSWSFSVW